MTVVTRGLVPQNTLHRFRSEAEWRDLVFSTADPFS